MRPLLATILLLVMSIRLWAADPEPAMRVEVNALDDLLVVLASPKAGGEPTELIAELSSLQGVLENRSWSLDKVDVIVSQTILQPEAVISQVESILFGRGTKRIVFRKSGKFGVPMDKLVVLKDSSS